MPADIGLVAQIQVDSSQGLKQVSDFARKADRLLTLPLGRMSQAASEFDKSLAAANARVIAFGASAGIIFGVQRAFEAMVSSTVKVEKSLKDIQIVMEDSFTADFGKRLFDVARNTGSAFDTVAKAATEFSRQGLNAEQTLKRTRDAMILARQSGMEATDAVDALTAAVNAYAGTGLNTLQVVNKLAAVDAKFAVSSGDIADALKRVGSSANDVGVDINSLIGLITSVKEITQQSGSVVGNSLKTLFSKISNPETLEFLDSLNVKIFDSNNNIKNADELLVGLAQKYKTLNPLLQNQVIQLTAGIYQSDRARALMSDLAEETSRYSRARDIANTLDAIALKRNEELNKTLAAALNSLKVTFTQFGASIGDSLIAEPINNIVDSVNTLRSAIDSLGQSAGGVAVLGMIEDVLQGIGQFVGGPGFIVIGTVVGKLFVDAVRFAREAMAAFLNINNVLGKQAEMQRVVSSLIQSQPRLLQDILSKKVSTLDVERQTLGLLREKFALESAIAKVAQPVAQKMVAQGTTLQSLQKQGQTKIPRFSPIAEAMAREERSGVPFSQIRVGTHPELKGPNNPRGLGVYNLLDEPQGLGQGVARAKSQGMDPRKHGIYPNFANERSPYTFNSIVPAAFSSLLDEQRKVTAEAIKSGKITISGQEDLNKIAKKLGQTFNADEKSIRRLTKSFTYAYNVAQANRPGNTQSAYQIANNKYPVPPDTSVSGLPFFYNSPRKLLAGGSKFDVSPNPLMDEFNGYKQKQLTGGSKFPLPGSQNTFFNSPVFTAAKNKTDSLSAQNASQQLIANKRSNLNLDNALKSVAGLNKEITNTFKSSGITPATNPKILDNQLRANLANQLRNSQGQGTILQGYRERLAPTSLGSGLGYNPFLASSPTLRQNALPTGQGWAFRPHAQPRPTFRSRLGTGVRGVARNSAIPLAFLGPIAGQSVADYYGQDTPDARYKSNIALGTGDVISYGATGAQLGMMFGGPKGAAIGTVAGLITGGVSAGSRAYQGNKKSKLDAADLRALRGEVETVNANNTQQASYSQFKDSLEFIRARKLAQKRENIFNDSTQIAQYKLDQDMGNVYASFLSENLGATGPAYKRSITQANYDSKIKESNINEDARLAAFQLRGKARDTLYGFGNNQIEQLRNRGLEGFSSNPEFENVFNEFAAKINEVTRKISLPINDPEALDLSAVYAEIATIVEQVKSKDIGTDVDFKRGFNDSADELQNQIFETVIAQKEVNSTKEREVAVLRETLKNQEELFHLNRGAFQRSQIRNGAIFSDDYANQMQDIRNENILGGRNRPLADAGQSFIDPLRYGVQDFYRDINDGAFEVGASLKTSFSDAFKEFANGAKSAEDALRTFALNVVGKIFDRVIDTSFNVFAGAIVSGAGALAGAFTGRGYATGGLVKRYASGGRVLGGSGYKDDVPALLTDGEYVLRKQAVNKYGPNLLNTLNEGSAKFLGENTFEYDSVPRPTSGKLKVDPNLSNFALNDENNPQNQRRMDRESELYQYVKDRKDYEEMKDISLYNYKVQQKNRIYSAYIAGAVGIAGAGIQAGVQSYQNSPSNISRLEARSAQGNAGASRSLSTIYGRQGDTAASQGYLRLAKSQQVTSSGLINRTGYAYASGGLVRKFAAGGPVGQDNVPALLMGGEYVMNRNAVNKHGIDLFNRLNTGKVSKFAVGGPVGNVSIGSQTSGGSSIDSKLSDSILKLISSTESLRESIEKRDSGNSSRSAPTGDSNAATQPVINVYTTVNMTSNANGEIKSTSSGENKDAKNNGDSDRTTNDKMAQQLEGAIIGVMIKNLRPGGVLHQAINQR